MFHVPPPGYRPTTTQIGEWMNFPQVIPNCPPGLESLAMVDQLLVQRIYAVDLSRDGFIIKNSRGQKVYYAEEDSEGSLLEGLRPFDMKIFDKYKNEAIHLYRPLACCCCFPCCMQSIEVLSSPGIVAGRVDEEWSILLPKYAVKNASGETVLRIKGPFRKNLCFGSVKFKIMSADGSAQLGKISWYEPGSRNDANFGITFPMDLDVRTKAVLLGAPFLINALYFEHQP